MRFPWSLGNEDKKLDLCHTAPQPKELEEIELHRSFLCSQMARLLVLVENLENPLSDEYHIPRKEYTETGNFFTSRSRGENLILRSVVAYDSQTGQRITARTTTTDSNKKIWLALDNFPLQILYESDETGELKESVQIQMGGHILETLEDEQTALRAIDRFTSILEAKPVRQDNTEKSTGTRPLNLVS